MNFCAISVKKLFKKYPRPIRTGVIRRLNKGINHLRLFIPRNNIVDKTNPNQAFREKVNIVHISVDKEKTIPTNLILPLEKFSFVRARVNGQIILSHIPK